MFVLGRDFNSKIGFDNCASVDAVEEMNLPDFGVSENDVTNSRGSLILYFMEENGYLVLNGRSLNDEKGRFIYVCSNRESVIGHIWVDISHIKFNF